MATTAVRVLVTAVAVQGARHWQRGRLEQRHEKLFGPREREHRPYELSPSLATYRHLARQAHAEAQREPWWNLWPTLQTQLILVLLAAMFAVGTGLFWRYRQFLAPDLQEQVALYGVLCMDYVILVAYYNGGLGFISDRVSAQADAFDATTLALARVLLAHAPYTWRLIRDTSPESAQRLLFTDQGARDLAALSLEPALPVPTAAAPPTSDDGDTGEPAASNALLAELATQGAWAEAVANPAPRVVTAQFLEQNKLEFTEGVIAALMLLAMVQVISLDSFPSPSSVAVFRDQMRSRQLQEAWQSNIMHISPTVRRFIVQNVWPGTRPPPMPSWSYLLFGVPIATAMWVTTALTIIGTWVWFAYPGVDAIAPTLAAKMHLYADLMDSWFTSLAFLLISISISDTSRAYQFRFTTSIIDNYETQFLAQYPLSIPLAQQMFPYSIQLKRVHVVRRPGESARAFWTEYSYFAWLFVREQLQGIDTQMNFSSFDVYMMSEWMNWLRSPTWRYVWPMVVGELSEIMCQWGSLTLQQPPLEYQVVYDIIAPQIQGPLSLTLR